MHKYIVQTPHSHNPKLNFNFRIMETDDISELEVDNELIAMISGEFENTLDVAERPRRPSREPQQPQVVVESLEEEETRELPEHRFVVKEDSEKITLFIGDNIFRRRYVRGDLATFTCTGCEKISRKTRCGNKGKKDASAVAQITGDGYVLLEAAVDDEHKCWTPGFSVKIKEAVDEMYSQVKKDPMKKISRVYQEVTAKITENLDYDERCALLQEWPTFRAVQSRLYKKKYELVPRDPENMKDFDADLHWCNISSGENIVKGDILLENGKRIVMFSSNALLDIAARASEILGDGTFKITPKLWHQVFVISVQVTSEVYVPAAVFLLPDKMGISYSAAFSLFREALETRGLSLAAKWFMSDFEPAIKIALTEQFPLIKPKGCSFHFSKAIITKVQKSGFKADYTKKENFAFSAFIRAILGLGLVFCLLDRFKESIRNLYRLAKRLKVIRQRKFSLYMINYVCRYWVNGCHHPEE